MVGMTPWLNAANTVLDDVISRLVVYATLEMVMAELYDEDFVLPILSGPNFRLVRTHNWVAGQQLSTIVILANA